jgi:hypothetical protein
MFSNKKIMRAFAIVILLLFIPTVVIAAVPMSAQTNNKTATYDEISIQSTPDETVTTVCTESTELSTSTELPPSTDFPIINTLSSSYKPITIFSSEDEHNIDYYHYDLLARAIYQESGSCGEYCQWLVGSAILNLADERGGIENVVFDYDTLNVAYVLYDATPSDLSYSVAKQLLCGNRDFVVKYFRTSHYHGFGTPYTSVDNVYFSTS